MTHEPDGVVTKVGDGVYDIRFERRYRLPIEKIWAALTEPERLSDWLAVAKVDLRVGGVIQLEWPEMGDHLDGRIVELDPPHLFTFSWSEPDGAPGSVVRWELSEEPDGCRLVMTNTLLRAGYLLDVGTGWHTLLDELPEAAARPQPRPWTTERAKASRARQRTRIDTYRARLPREAAAVEWVE